MYQRFDFSEKKVKPDAVIAFVLGVVVAYIVQVMFFGVSPGGVFTTLIVVAVGGAWYHWRKIL